MGNSPKMIEGTEKIVPHSESSRWQSSRKFEIPNGFIKEVNENAEGTK